MLKTKKVNNSKLYSQETLENVNDRLDNDPIDQSSTTLFRSLGGDCKQPTLLGVGRWG